MKCVPLYFPGPWDAVVVPAALYFSSPVLRKGPDAANVLVYGPAHLFRAAWLSGVRDYLRDPWSVEELYLRLRGPEPAFVEWSTGGQSFHLEGRTLAESGGTLVPLSAAESALLRILVQRRGTAVSRPVLAWAATCSDGRVVDTLVSRIRGKLKNLGIENSIVTVRGLGYRLP